MKDSLFTKKILNADEVCEWLRIPKSTLYKLCIRREIPCTKVGKHWRFDSIALESWFEEKVHGSSRE